MATAVLSLAEIAAPIRQLEVKQRNLNVLLAKVTSVDVASRTIEASSPGMSVRKIAFDYLVVATGVCPSYFGHDEFARFLHSGCGRRVACQRAVAAGGFRQWRNTTPNEFVRQTQLRLVREELCAPMKARTSPR